MRKVIDLCLDMPPDAEKAATTIEDFISCLNLSKAVPYDNYGEARVQDKLCFASNWTTQCEQAGDIIAQVEALPFTDIAKGKVLYENAARVLRGVRITGYINIFWKEPMHGTRTKKSKAQIALFPFGGSAR